MTIRMLLISLLLMVVVGMLLLAVSYLRRRRLALLDYLGWGLLALMLPILGPFLVIVFQPGEPLRS